MTRLHKPKKKRPRKCMGCGHAAHPYYCIRIDTSGRRIWACQCHYERPLTKRKRKRLTGRTRSRSCRGHGPVSLVPEQDVLLRYERRPPKKVARMNEMYDHIIDTAVD